MWLGNETLEEKVEEIEELEEVTEGGELDEEIE